MGAPSRVEAPDITLLHMRPLDTELTLQIASGAGCHIWQGLTLAMRPQEHLELPAPGQRGDDNELLVGILPTARAVGTLDSTRTNRHVGF